MKVLAAPDKGERYLTVTPAFNEERLLPGLISSMVAQTRLPGRWIIVDDGSTDGTQQILRDAARRYPWIEHKRLERSGGRDFGGESVIMKALPTEVWFNLDFILRIDADISFNADFVQSLIAEFAKDPALGIAGGTIWERSDGRWKEITQPAFHVSGATKMYTTECFSAIGGLEAGLGWDTIDEAKAMMMGFRTRTFAHIRVNHHRPQGSSSGLRRGRLAKGRAAYNAGYSPLFMIARAAGSLSAKPRLLGSAYMLAGFFEGYLRGKPKTASPDLIRFVRGQQLRRLLLMESVWR